MAQLTGTYTVSDLLAAKNLSVIKGGLSTVADVLAADNANFSAQLTSALGELCETSADRQRTVGSSIGGDMVELDELGRAPTTRDVPSYLLGFPLRRLAFATGWSKQWEKNATPADYAIKNQGAQMADLRMARRLLKIALYNPTNVTYKDHLVDNAPVPVKAFVNADAQPIANGPNGELFDGTSHTHYTGAASLSAVTLQALINNVAEHRNGVAIRVYLNYADVATVSALTGFIPLQVPYVSINMSANQVADPRLDISKLDNRMIGLFGQAEVWTKPWAVANYAVACDVAAPQKPLVRRVETNDQGLYIAAEVDAHPLRAQYIEHFYGFGAWNRTAVAVLQFNNASYSAPTITS